MKSFRAVISRDKMDNQFEKTKASNSCRDLYHFCHIKRNNSKNNLSLKLRLLDCRTAFYLLYFVKRGHILGMNRLLLIVRAVPGNP